MRTESANEMTIPLAFTTKLWRMGPKNIIIKVPKELREKAEEWRGERVYVLILPVKALEKQEVILKSKSG